MIKILATAAIGFGFTTLVGLLVHFGSSGYQKKIAAYFTGTSLVAGLFFFCAFTIAVIWS